MAYLDLVMPRMGESIIEATILKWHKNSGDVVAHDETILEIATDKVDTEIPSPATGIITELLFAEGEVVAVGSVIARLQVDDGKEHTQEPVVPLSVDAQPSISAEEEVGRQVPGSATDAGLSEAARAAPGAVAAELRATLPPVSVSGRFYSPLVRKIAKEEGLGLQQLEEIAGTGLNGRVTKKDLLAFIESRAAGGAAVEASAAHMFEPYEQRSQPIAAQEASVSSGADEIVEMDRMRKLIADHMTASRKTSAHVTSFVEVDMTEWVKWREKVNDDFARKYGFKLTYTPVFIEAVTKAIRDFPMINSSVDQDRLIIKRDIHIGMATALPSGHLIVPVIRHADQFNLVGLARQVNDLAVRARNNQLKPEDIGGGTFTVTNVGMFGSIMGTPIINQPQVAILATGVIKKKPAVVETKYGDLIAIRHLMFLSLSYDHRVIDGMLGGSFLRKIADYLEAFQHDDGVF